VRCDRCRTDLRSSRLSDCGLHLVPDVTVKVTQELTGSSFSVEKRIGLWDQTAQQSCPWPVTVPTGRVTDGDRSSFTDNPLGIPQQKCSYRTPTARRFSSRPAPPTPSSRWRTATSKQNRHHGKELGNESDTCCLSKRGGWSDVQGKKTMQQACVLLQTVRKCQASGTLACLQIMSSSIEVQQTYIFTLLSTWNPLNTSVQNVPQKHNGYLNYTKSNSKFLHAHTKQPRISIHIPFNFQ
jgi:hypothetical protein